MSSHPENVQVAREDNPAALGRASDGAVFCVLLLDVLVSQLMFVVFRSLQHTGLFTEVTRVVLLLLPFAYLAVLELAYPGCCSFPSLQICMPSNRGGLYLLMTLAGIVVVYGLALYVAPHFDAEVRKLLAQLPTRLPAPLYQALVARDWNSALPMLFLREVRTLLIAPVVEEILYRGLFFKALRAHFGQGTSMLVVGLFFVAAHDVFSGGAQALPVGRIVQLLLFNYMSCYFVTYSSSLIPSMVAHFGSNFITESLQLGKFFAPLTP